MVNLSPILTVVDQTLVGLVATAALAYIPIIVPKIIKKIEAEIAALHQPLVSVLAAQGVAYFKAHEADFEKEGIQVLDFAIAHVQSHVPGLSVAQIEPVVSLAIKAAASAA